ncbi:MAG TPA: translation initiation factor IF-3 [Bacillota bacterium]|nr:translation initiation factor IF-3 [Clostridiaceae bacterium]HNR05258.1 translation initiation factor IF-3 [Bacillota bacterium]HNT02324.1 translation initiation factor IF-3 [Bacillota bacterium]HPL98860.1 translation initiation factor IF-3 [Bacillota bacterium]HPX68129.1 translation initiation factor IF-3 [Bacillota bacterium]
MSSNKDLQINEEIRDRELRIIDSNGDQLGIMSSRQALELAAERQLDLVKIAPQAKPPVCRIMDYGKFKFEQSKKEKEARRNQKIVNIKEIRFSPTIEEHDLNVKAKNAQKFLQEGDKVKVTIRFRGREVDHVSFGEKALGRFYDIVKDYCVVEKPAKLEGRNMIMILAPKQ